MSFVCGSKKDKRECFMKQIIIISEDRPGVVAEISEAMAAASVNIETIAAETAAGWWPSPTAARRLAIPTGWTWKS